MCPARMRLIECNIASYLSAGRFERAKDREPCVIGEKGEWGGVVKRQRDP